MVKAGTSLMRFTPRRLRLVILVAATLATSLFAWAETEEPLHCFSTAQTRERIAQHKLGEPFAPMRAAADHLQGEAIGARLCQSNDVLVYEVSVLRRDGRILKILIDAASGAPHSAHKER